MPSLHWAGGLPLDGARAASPFTLRLMDWVVTTRPRTLRKSHEIDPDLPQVSLAKLMSPKRSHRRQERPRKNLLEPCP